MSSHSGDDDPKRILRREGSSLRVIALGSEVDAIAERAGLAVSFGWNRQARVLSPVGMAVTFGGGTAEAQQALTLGGTAGMAIASLIAVSLDHRGMAVGQKIAFSSGTENEAHSQQLAIASGARSVADGVLSIALGQEAMAIARAGGTIAIAYYDQHPGHWETPHGSDPYWEDGDYFLSGLKVAKVGENGIRPDFIYKLDREGNFVEVGPAAPQRACPAP